MLGFVCALRSNNPTRNQVVHMLSSAKKSKYFTFYCCLSPKLIQNMMQEPVLFSVSVGENIAYGLPDDYVSKDDVIKAAKAANAHEFIISLPQVFCLLNMQIFYC